MEPRHIESGIHATVYQLDDLRIAKVFTNQWLNYDTGIHSKLEYEVGLALDAAGISVPKMHELIDPSESEEFGLISGWTIIMDYIKGVDTRYVTHDKRPHVQDLVNNELQKAKNLGYKPSFDANLPGNAIYVSDLDKIFLIDFALWRVPSKNSS